MQEKIKAVIEAAAGQLFGQEPSVVLTRPEPAFGDYATNLALQLGKTLGQAPRQIAEQLAGELATRLKDDVAAVEVAGPGFINIRLNDAALAAAMAACPARPLAGQIILTEYSDPNPFKPLHAGHLYTTLVGDAISRLVEVAGGQVTRLNFGGDVGPHVAKSIWAIVSQLGGELPDKLVDVAAADRPAWLGERYVEGNAAYEDNPAAKAQIQDYNQRIYQIQAVGDHDSPLAQIYWTCRQWSYDYFAELYKQLQVKPFDRFIPESEVTPLGLKTVQAQLQNGIFTESDGAVVFKGDNHGLHTRVFINRQGLPTYEAKDVGLSLTKWQDYHFDESIIITANEQMQYMQVVLKAIEQFAPEPARRTRHLTHGVVKLQGGVKMSSRKGNTVTAMDILAAARQAGAATGTNPTEDTILAAVKYALTKSRLGGDIVYDPKESIALEGNSGPYLQYAHARARSILAKAAVQPAADFAPELLKDLQLEPDERALIRQIGRYAETVDLAVSELMPHHIATYLYELAQSFNQFYEKNRVIGSGPREALRLGLVRQYADRLQSGLNLLGINAPDHL